VTLPTVVAVVVGHRVDRTSDIASSVVLQDDGEGIALRQFRAGQVRHRNEIIHQLRASVCLIIDSRENLARRIHRDNVLLRAVKITGAGIRVQ
jgi:hypothetical protein